jgi:hypothetical protein
VKTCECQKVYDDDATFCMSCGRRLPETDTADAAPTPTESIEVDHAIAERRKRLRTIVTGFVAVTLIVAVGLTFGLRNVHIDFNSQNLVSAQLPLNVCKTSVGVSSGTPANLPATLRVKIAPAYSTGLAVYSDNEGVIEVVAPVGWNCSALIGADGSSWVHVSPPGQAPISGDSLSGTTAEAITALQTSACVGCRESLACPLFTSAANDYVQTFQKTCPTTKPSSETETEISGHVVEFTDPPGIVGDANPSGGTYSAQGVMTYFDDLASDGSWTETCVLPPVDSSMCQAIIGNFVNRYGNR